jgi:Zn-dependent M28 family amino/carboxypeptidase
MKLVASQPGSGSIPATIRELLIDISPDHLRGLVESFSVPRVYGTAENEAVRQRLIDLFTSFDFDRSSIEEDEDGNVIVGNHRATRVLVGAHYDAVPGTPEADDNASALAVLLAAARTIGPSIDVCFVAFNGEECNLLGSRGFVERLGRNRLKEVHVLEMVGYASREPGSQQNPIPPLRVPTVGDFLGLVGTHRSRRVLGRVLTLADSSTLPVQGLYLPPVPLAAIRRLAPHVLRSDHAPFWEVGIPALMWTDTAEFRNPNYHSTFDTPETLDYEFMVGVARLLVHAVLTGIGQSS